MKKLRIVNILFLLAILGCEQPNFFVGGGQSLDLEAPKLTLLTPANFSFVPANFSIEGIATDNVGVDKVVVIISKDSEAPKTYNATISGDKFTVNITNYESGEYSVVINAYDKARNTSSTSSKSISITVDAGASDLALRKPPLFPSLSEDILDSKKVHVYSDLDYFRNEEFEISGTVDEDYGIGALTLQLEFAGSYEEGGTFNAAKEAPVVWNYRIFRKNGEYYYNTGEDDVLAQGLFSGSLNNFCFKIDSSKISIDKSPLEYDVKYYFKVHMIAEKKTVPVESSSFNPGYVCIYPKSDEPWVAPSFAEGTSFSAGSSIFGEAYDDDGLSEQGVFYCITANDKPQPKLEDFTPVGSSADSKSRLMWKIDLQKDILPGKYKLWYYAVEANKEHKEPSKSSVSCLDFQVPDPGQPVSEIEMFTGTDKSQKASEYPADSSGNFLLAGSAYDTSNVQAVIFAWVPQKAVVPDNWRKTDWSEIINEGSSGTFKGGVKYWRIPLGTPESTSDGRKRYDIALPLNDRTDFKLEDGTVEYSNKYFYIFTKGADDANGKEKFTILNFTVPKDLTPPEVEVEQPETDTAGEKKLPVEFVINAHDGESEVDTVSIYADGMRGEKKAVQSDGLWKVTVDSSDFIVDEINDVKKFIVTAQDLYGNKKQAIRSVTINNTLISISKVTCKDEDRSKTKGIGAEPVEIYVIADGEVTTTTTGGTPRLKLNVDNSDGSAVYATYSKIDNTGLENDSDQTRLVFVYTIAEGDTAFPLNVEALELNGGKIEDGIENGISGNIPVSGATSLRNCNIIIDTTPPQIQSITTSVPKGAYGKGSVIDIRIGFDRALGSLDSGTCTLTLNTRQGGKDVWFDSSKVTVDGNTAVFRYTVSDGENAEKLDVLWFKNDGMIADERGNKPAVLQCTDMEEKDKLAKFEIAVDTKAPEIVSYGVNGRSEIPFNETTYNVGTNSKIEIEFDEPVMKYSGSILLERVYKSYPAVMTTEEKASYESIRSFNWDTYYVNRCIGTVGNNGTEPDKEGKWVLKYNYRHGAYKTYDKADTTDSNGDGVGALWNFFADVGVSSPDKCLDYNTVRIDIQSGLVKVDGKKVTITLAKPLPEGIMFSIKVKGVFTDRANNESVDSDTPICQFETVNAAASVIRINKLSGLESGSQPKSTYFKISSETQGASYFYGLTDTMNTGAIPQNDPFVTSPYSNAVPIGNNDENAYVYKIYAKTIKGENSSEVTKELAFKTVIYNLPTNANAGAYGSDSTGGPASTTEFPLAWGSYVYVTENGNVTQKCRSKATNGFLYSWHILKDFQFKLAYGPNAQWEANDPPNTPGRAGKKCNLYDRW